MNLTKRMSLGVLSLLMLVFIGTYLITLHNERLYFKAQFDSNAQDTATSLGLSLSQSLGKNDKPMMLAMVQAVFDRGFFSRIEVRDLKNNIIVSRALANNKYNVPQWFVNLIGWESGSQSALVMDGWRQVGRVAVYPDPRYAYNALWENAKGLMLAYLIFAFCALIIVYSFIHWLLKPLQRVTRQALAICAREFPIEDKIPSTLEFKQVTLAMNQMVTRIKTLFDQQSAQTEELRQQAYQDQLTGLANKRFFIQHLNAMLSNEEDYVPGYLLIIAIDGLDEANHEHGYKYGDELVLTVTKVLNDIGSKVANTFIARLNGSQFGMLIKEKDADKLMVICLEIIQNIQQSFKDHPGVSIALGAMPYELNQQSSGLLTITDKALNQARLSPNRVNLGLTQTAPSFGGFSQSDIEEAVAQQNFVLYAQPVVGLDQYFHNEILIQLLCQDKEIPAGYFMSLLEQQQLAHKVDTYVLDKVSSLPTALQTHYALNISEDTLIIDEYSAAYIKKLKSLPKEIRQQLHIEITEQFVMQHFDKVAPFIKKLHQAGVTVGIDKVGVNFSRLHYLNEISPHYVKLHGSLIQDIDDNQSKQFFIHYFNEMAKTLDIQVIATQIEQEQQWTAVRNMHIVWGQGRYLAPVHKMESEDPKAEQSAT